LELRPDSSGGGVDSIALGKLIEVMAVIGDQPHYTFFSLLLPVTTWFWFSMPFRSFQKKAKAVV